MWSLGHIRLPDYLPSLIEEPDEFIDTLDLNGEWELLLFLGESPSAFTLLPIILSRLSTKAVIAPVDDYLWLPLGLERQIRSELAELRVEIVFPRTFCTITPRGIQFIDEFAELFGAPSIEFEDKEGTLKTIKVLRGAPCGSTWYMAEKLKGIKSEEAPEKAATYVQIYPCLASRRVERILGDAPIHIAAYMAANAVKRSIKKKMK
jgi:hypothetical protein